MFKFRLLGKVLNFSLKALINKISYEPIKVYLKNQVEPVVKVVKILTDKNPKNNEQLKKLWEEERAEFKLESLESSKEIIQLEMRDGEGKELIIELLCDEIEELKTLKLAS